MHFYAHLTFFKIYFNQFGNSFSVFNQCRRLAVSQRRLEWPLDALSRGCGRAAGGHNWVADVQTVAAVESRIYFYRSRFLSLTIQIKTKIP
jgi:hypothetical protein